MPWQPGQSGNPAGRPPKGKALSDVLNDILDEPMDGGDDTKRESLCRRLITQALGGDMKAAAWVADRAEGRVATMNAEPNAMCNVPIRILTWDGDTSMSEET